VNKKTDGFWIEDNFQIELLLTFYIQMIPY